MKKLLISLSLILAIPAMPVYAETNSPTKVTQTIYSLDELKKAKEKISENREAFGITSISTSVKDNSIIVTAPIWDDNKKNEVIEIAGIENIIFKVTDGTVAFVPKIHYEIKIDIPEITIDDEKQKIAAAPFESNGIYMLPISEMLAVTGYKPTVDKANQTMITKIGDTTLTVDLKTNTVFINETKINLLVDPVIKNNSFYMAYNDLKDIVSVKNANDAKNISFFWDLSNTNDLESTLKNLPIKNIYKFAVGSNTYLKNDISNKIAGTIYKKGENMLIPIRTVAEMMSANATVKWDDSTKTASILYSGKTYEFSYKTNELKVNTVATQLPAPLELNNGRLYVPIIDCLVIQYHMGNKMDTFDIYKKDDTTIYVRM